MRSHYDILNISKNASLDVIQAAYRALSKKYHPDLNPNNPESNRIMTEINNAFEIISDPLKRQKYDLFLNNLEGEKKPKPKPEPKPKPKPPDYTFYPVIIAFIFLLFLILSVNSLSKRSENNNHIQFNTNNSNAIDTIKSVATKDTIKVQNLNEDFDLKISSLPNNFQGYSLEQLYNELIRDFPPKDKFESNKLYLKRFRLNKLYRLIPITSKDGQFSSYDIENQIMTISLINPTKSTNSTSQTQGNPNNQITHDTYTTYCIYEIKPDSVRSSIINENISFKISPEEGRELKKNLGILKILVPEINYDPQAELASLTYENTDTKNIGRTYNQEFVSTIINYYIYATIKQIWVYNTNNGKIYFKKNVNKELQTLKRTLRLAELNDSLLTSSIRVQEKVVP